MAVAGEQAAELHGLTPNTQRTKGCSKAGVPHVQREPSEGWTWLGPKLGAARRLLRSVTEH